MKNSSIEQELETHGRSLFQTVGDSMEPLLHNRYSTVVIEKVTGPLAVNDVALFRRPPGVLKTQPDGAYVLHRIVKVREKDYLICGDNRYYREPVPKEWVLGVMTGYFNGDTFVDCAANEDYRDYVNSLKYRYPIRWLKALPGRAAGKVKRIIYEIIKR